MALLTIIEGRKKNKYDNLSNKSLCISEIRGSKGLEGHNQGNWPFFFQSRAASCSNSQSNSLLYYS